VSLKFQRYEWILLIWLSGLLLSELTNPSDKSGLGWIKLAVLLFGMFGVGLHLAALLIDRPYWPTVFYLRYFKSIIYSFSKL
jgi:hypothetical protein